jgi:hypothetical protein
MRRSLAALLLLPVLLLTNGCGRPAGVDGNLVNGWPTLPAVAIPPQQVGSCYRTEYNELWNEDLVVINCDGGSWRTQVVYVGAFDAADTKMQAPPLENGPSRIAAYTTCGKQADAGIGGDWHTVRVELGLVVPSPDDWSAGQRWYRCDLRWTTGSGGSLHNGFTTMPLNLRVSCLTVTASGCRTVDAAYLGFADGTNHNPHIDGAPTYPTNLLATRRPHQLPHPTTMRRTARGTTAHGIL